MKTKTTVTTYIVTKKDFRTDKIKELESFKTMREAKAHILKLVYGQVNKYVPIELFDVKIKVADVVVKPQELTKEQLTQDFDKGAIDFINAIFSIEKKEIPKFENSHEVLLTFSRTLLRINDELLWHRNKPMSENKLNSLRCLLGMGTLPKSTEAILKSFSESD